MTRKKGRPTPKPTKKVIVRDLKELCDKLDPRSRAAFISDLVSREQIHIPEDMIDESLSYLEKSGNYEKAAELARDAGWMKRANRNAEKCDYRILAEFMKEFGDIKRAIDIYEINGDFSDAIRLAEGDGLKMKAVDLYEKAGEFFRAGNLLGSGNEERKRRLYERAFEEAEREEDFAEAAHLAQRLGRLEDSVRFYEKAEAWYDATILAIEVGMLDKAKELGEKAMLKLLWQNDYHNPRYLAEKLGDERESLFRRMDDLSLVGVDALIPD